MPMVRTATKVFVANSLREEGEVFDYDGPPNKYLVPLEVPAESPPPSPSMPDAPPAVEKAKRHWGGKINGEP